MDRGTYKKPEERSHLAYKEARSSDLPLVIMSNSVPLEEFIDKLVKENKVVAFIKGSRGFSQRELAFLKVMKGWILRMFRA
ncbi:hypothetical protein SLEP1_g17976 [Rubroshorea leprosula]|uniref:Phosphopyruvate hydratase n=1 Tax=Rubroshorea leprosula TaxID=152421 RepID=A0AAV5J4Y8_9ROSI|nr:hypothetical protein SLEP1_g17976 [Rubroshorea leprosula]